MQLTLRMTVQMALIAVAGQLCTGLTPVHRVIRTLLAPRRGSAEEQHSVLQRPLRRTWWAWNGICSLLP